MSAYEAEQTLQILLIFWKISSLEKSKKKDIEFRWILFINKLLWYYVKSKWRNWNTSQSIVWMMNSSINIVDTKKKCNSNSWIFIIVIINNTDDYDENWIIQSQYTVWFLQWKRAFQFLLISTLFYDCILLFFRFESINCFYVYFFSLIFVWNYSILINDEININLCVRKSEWFFLPWFLSDYRKKCTLKLKIKLPRKMNSMCSSNTFETLKLAAKIFFFFKTKVF